VHESKPLHVGATVGGVVGQKMLRYHLFGPPLTGVERMEQACDSGGVRQGRATNRTFIFISIFLTFIESQGASHETSLNTFASPRSLK